MWYNSPPLPWEDETARFYAALQSFDSYLASDEPLGAPVEKLFQGPIADALTHVGQIAMLRRIAGCPIKGENYFKAVSSRDESVRTSRHSAQSLINNQRQHDH